MTSLRFVIAESEQHIRDSGRVRFRVYVEEERLLPATAGVLGCELDARDFCQWTSHLLVYEGSDPVGTIRLTRRPGDGSREPRGLELETQLALRGFEAPAIVLAEVTRYCILRQYRCTRAASVLFAGLLTESMRHGVSHWVAAANMETDSVADAAIAYRLVQLRSLVSPNFSAHATATVSPRAPARRFLYTDQQRRRAEHGDFAELELPRTLSLFARSMGARFIGEPVYDSKFEVFALPLVAEVNRETALARRIQRQRQPCPLSARRPVAGEEGGFSPAH